MNAARTFIESSYSAYADQCFDAACSADKKDILDTWSSDQSQLRSLSGTSAKVVKNQSYWSGAEGVED
jgi:hypothetical protein